MGYYMATICNDGTGVQIVVHWDDLDPNRFITSPIKLRFPIADEAELENHLGTQGWRVVSNGSDNVGRGWAIVARRDTRWPFYNPISEQWQVFLTDAEKCEIAQRWPDARVPGTGPTVRF
jgi:hypothetical protein